MNKITTTGPDALPDALNVVARTPGSTGHQDFSTLLAQVAAETGFKPHQSNPLTGAAGPFQFIGSTWLGLVKQYGTSAGIKSDLVAQITTDAHGHPTVKDQKALSDLLALRHDPVLATKMAAHYLDESEAALKHTLKRQPTEAEIHMAYLLGPTGATHLIQAAASAPATPVEDVIGAAARSNRSLFEHASGVQRTAAESVAFLTHKFLADKGRVSGYVRTADAGLGSTADLDA